MPDRPLARLRLVAQGLAMPLFARPEEAVAAFGLMQGQDLTGVLASAALRTGSGRMDEVLDDLNSGLLVRGYPMRGTVFLGPAADMRWMTELCAGAAIRAAARRRGQLDLQDADIERVFDTVAPRATGAGLTRTEFQDLLHGLGIDPSGGRGYHVLTALISEGRLTYGPWNGSDQQIVLAAEALGPGLEERFGGDDVAAVAELASRYFRTRGPATVTDFAWWTKLPLGRIRAAVPRFDDDIMAMGAETFARAALLEEFGAAGREVAKPLLLPAFDEYILGYRDRLFAMDEATHTMLVPGNNGVFKKSVVVDGVVRGFWTRGGAVGRRKLEVTELTGIPKAAWPGVRRRFDGYPFIRA